MEVLKQYLDVVGEHFSDLLCLAHHRALMAVAFDNTRSVFAALKLCDCDLLCETLDRVSEWAECKNLQDGEGPAPKSVPKLVKKTSKGNLADMADEDVDCLGPEAQTQTLAPSDDPIANLCGGQTTLAFVGCAMDVLLQKAFGQFPKDISEQQTEAQRMYDDMVQVEEWWSAAKIVGDEHTENANMVKSLKIVFQVTVASLGDVEAPSPGNVVWARQTIDVLARQASPRLSCRSFIRFSNLERVRALAQQRCAVGRSDARGDQEFAAAVDAIREVFSTAALSDRCSAERPKHEIQEFVASIMGSLTACDAQLGSIMLALTSWSPLRAEEQAQEVLSAIDLLCNAMLAGQMSLALAAEALMVCDEFLFLVEDKHVQGAAQAVDAPVPTPAEGDAPLAVSPSADLEVPASPASRKMTMQTALPAFGATMASVSAYMSQGNKSLYQLIGKVERLCETAQTKCPKIGNVSSRVVEMRSKFKTNESLLLTFAKYVNYASALTQGKEAVGDLANVEVCGSPLALAHPKLLSEFCAAHRTMLAVNEESYHALSRPWFRTGQARNVQK